MGFYPVSEIICPRKDLPSVAAELLPRAEAQALLVQPRMDHKGLRGHQGMFGMQRSSSLRSDC